jgi:hypothetical protein
VAERSLRLQFDRFNAHAAVRLLRRLKRYHSALNRTPMLRFCLRTLLILLAVLPPMLAGFWFGIPLAIGFVLNLLIPGFGPSN